MNLLILGDVMGASGRKAVSNKLPDLIKKYKINFVIVNGENSSDDGKGITQDITEEFFKSGVDVITSGNHIWDKKDTTDFIEKEKRLNNSVGFKKLELLKVNQNYDFNCAKFIFCSTNNIRFTVYKNPYQFENVILVGFRGSNFLETGAVYAPYVPMIMTPLVYDPTNFTPRKGVMTRYAKKIVRPEFYGLVVVADVDKV